MPKYMDPTELTRCTYNSNIGSSVNKSFDRKIFRQSRTQDGGERLSADAVHDDDKGHDQITFVARPDDQAKYIVAQQKCGVCFLPRYLCCDLPIAISDLTMPASKATINSKIRCHDTNYRTPHENFSFITALDYRSPSHRKNWCFRTCF